MRCRVSVISVLPALLRCLVHCPLFYRLARGKATAFSSRRISRSRRNVTPAAISGHGPARCRSVSVSAVRKSAAQNVRPMTAAAASPQRPKATVSAARSSRPPSSGQSGSRLNAPSSRLAAAKTGAARPRKQPQSRLSAGPAAVPSSSACKGRSPVRSVSCANPSRKPSTRPPSKSNAATCASSWTPIAASTGQKASPPQICSSSKKAGNPGVTSIRRIGQHVVGIGKRLHGALAVLQGLCKPAEGGLCACAAALQRVPVDHARRRTADAADVRQQKRRRQHREPREPYGCSAAAIFCFHRLTPLGTAYARPGKRCAAAEKCPPKRRALQHHGLENWWDFILEAKYPVFTGFFSQSVGIMQK